METVQSTNRPLSPSNILSKKQLEALCEVSDFETGEFLRSTFTYIDEHDFAWFGQARGVRKYDLTAHELRKSLRLIPDEKIYPKVTPSITVVPTERQTDFFVKRPKLLCLDNEEEAKLLPPMVIEEAKVLEFLKLNHHPNLVRYHGCVVKRGRITGIALERHAMILQYRYEDDERYLDVNACLDGIRAGLRHLHSLGLAHNDLNPTNIALDEEDNPIILDFGSCRRFGEQLISAGTPGWIDEDYTISGQRNDESALRKLAVWLENQKFGKANRTSHNN